MDNRGMKKVIAVILDVLFLAVIIFAVYLLVVNNFISVDENILYAVIILLIPTGFYMTFASFARKIDWDKLPGDDDENQTENEAEDTARTEGDSGSEKSAVCKSGGDEKTGY